MTDVQILAGWDVHSYDADPAQITHLARYLARVAALLPGPVLSVVQRAKIYVHAQSKWREKEGEMTFHWSTDYLSQNGRNLPDSPVEGSIEIHNIGCLLQTLSTWPGSLAHELGHAFHYYRFLDADQKIKAVFEKSQSLSCYRRSRRIEGGPECVSYAVENEYSPRNFYKEYWACLFASYFDKSNFSPFDKEMLRTGDSDGYALIQYLTTNL